MTEFDDQHYATNLTLSNNTDSTTGRSNDDYIRTIIGNNGNRYPVELLQDIRKNLKNIDDEIISELSDLFMSIY